MNKGSTVTVTNKDGTSATGTFVSQKSGWAVVEIDGVETKIRANLLGGDAAPAKKAAKKAAAKKAAKKVPAKKAAAKKAGEEGDARLIRADLAKYVIHETKTGTGRRHLDVNDQTAAKLRDMQLPAIYKYASEVCEVSQRELHEKYDHLNIGMQRMNLGNRIRAVFRVGEKIQTGFRREKKGANGAAHT